MDHKAAIEIILDIQESYDVNSVMYEDLHVWPLIRRFIWNNLIDLKLKWAKEQTESLARLPIWSRIFASIKKPYMMNHKNRYILFGDLFFWPKKKSIKAKGRLDVLFISRHENYSTKINGLSYDQIIDPLIEILEPEHDYLKVGLSSQKMESTFPQYTPTVLFQPRLFLSWYRLLKKLSLKHNSIVNFSQLRKFVLEKIDSIDLNEDYFLDVIAEIEAYQSFYTYLLQKLKPQVVFMACFYYFPNMSLIRACQKLNITTVDIQHGKQGKYHGHYSHLTRIPEDGYQLYPDYFWVWGQESKDNIEKWKPPDNHNHQAIVGGNLWLTKWLKNDDLIDKTSKERIKSITDGFEKMILVSLQKIDTPIPDHLLEAMRFSPDTWKWLLRLHPRQRDQQEPIAEYLSKNGVKNVDIKYSTYTPLYALLKNVDHHITCWSSVCFEALSFNIPTTIVHPYGQLLYDEYIDQGIFSFALSAEEILSNISKFNMRNKFDDMEPYIETDLKKAKLALNVILSSDEDKIVY